MSKTSVTLSPEKISDKWNRRLKAAVPDIQAGIQAVTESPTEKAAAKADKMLANLTAAVQKGVWANQLRKVTLSDWKSKTFDKVGTRLAGGVDAAMPKRKIFDQWLVSTVNSVLPSISSMPDMNLEDSFQRVRRFMEHMAANKFKAS